MTNFMDTVPKDLFITEKNTCAFRYKWIIKDFSFYSNEVLKSSTFSSGLLNYEDKWCLEINPMNGNYISVSLKLDSVKEGTTLRGTVSVSILHVSEERSKHYTRRYSTPPFSTQNNAVNWTDFIGRSTLLDPSQGYLLNDNLTILCEMKILVDNSILNSTKKAVKIENCQLKDNFKQLLESEMSADVIIKIGDTSFKAIKGILAARSPVFSGMFSHGELKENKKNEVIIEDIDVCVFHELLHFIYTDQTPNIETFAEDLLVAADKYQLNRLKNLCEDELIKKITVEYAAELLVYADRYNAVQLKMEISEFIQNKLRDVVHTKGYKTYKKTHGELFVEVLEAIAEKN